MSLAGEVLLEDIPKPIEEIRLEQAQETVRVQDEANKMYGPLEMPA